MTTNGKKIDLRSDTVTQPTTKMRKAMAEASVGDDVYGEDPTVNRLEQISAQILGTETAIYVSSGTQSNLIALLCHCERGDEYIVSQMAHTYKYECGGAAVLGSIQPQPLEFESDGTLDLKKAASFVKPDDVHFAKTKLFCLENTYWGKVLPFEYLEKAEQFAKQHQLSLHLDGARIFNAAVKLSRPVTDISKYFDTVSVCLSKGLGAPVGSVLCGSQDFIKKARRWRKMLGGGMRQAGILAAAGIIALEEQPARLIQDHENAIRLAEGLSSIDEIRVDSMDQLTNMVFIHVTENDAESLPQYLKENGILTYSGTDIRLVTHLDIDEADIDYTIKTIKSYFQ